MEVEQIAPGILSREKTEKITLRVADTQIFAREGQAYGYKGPTIAERFGEQRVHWGPADKSRIQGLDQIRSRLRGDDDGNPMLVIFETCKDILRTLPVLQHDDLNPEDLDTDSEDHAADELRYACMARPWIKDAPRPARTKSNDYAAVRIREQSNVVI
jgi:hypothetical protein